MIVIVRVCVLMIVMMTVVLWGSVFAAAGGAHQSTSME
jgi:hypothetical protein